MDLVRNHVLYWGPPAAAKTRILRGIRRILPAGSFIEIDAPSLTAAGLVDIFLTTYRDHCPPIVFVDEFEKVNEKVLVKWDEMLDERASASKNTYFEKDRVKVPFLCIAACNDKDKLDKKLEGAISSRFATQIYVPKPSQEEMEVILLDQIQLMNGNPEWAQQCINFMDMFGCDDARMVKGWLSYGDGLLTGSALQDLTDILNRQRKDLGYHYEPTGNPYQDSLAELKLNHQMHHASHKNRRRRRGS
jgi:SpoVK/Ycf46/Vps4 family AAA+-type ATPase